MVNIISNISDIQRVRNNDPSLTHLTLMDPPYAECIHFAEAMVLNTRITKVTLAISCQEKAETILGALKNSRIKTLDIIGYCEMNSAIIGPLVASVIHDLALEALSFSEISFQNEAFLFKSLKQVSTYTPVRISDEEREMLLKSSPELLMKLEKGRKCKLKFKECRFSKLSGLIKSTIHDFSSVTEIEFNSTVFSACSNKEKSLKEKQDQVNILALAQQLRTNRTVSVLRLSRCCLYRIEEIADALFSNASSNLQELDLSYNAFGDEGAIALGKMLGNQQLKLRRLNLSHCEIKKIRPVAEGVVSCSTLLELNLADNPVPGEEFEEAEKAISAIFEKNSTLTDLNLSNCNLTRFEMMGEALKKNRALRRFDFSENPLYNCADGIAGVLSANSVLTHLNLDSCKINLTKIFSAAIKSNGVLKYLNINSNSFVGEEAQDSFEKALRDNQSLTSLEMQFLNKFDAIKFVKTLGEDPILKTCPSIAELSLKKNRLGEEGGKALLEVLKSNRKIKKLDISDCYIPISIWEAITAKVKINSSSEQDKKEADLKEVQGLFTTRLSMSTMEKLKELPAKHEALEKQVNQLALMDANIDPQSLALLKGRASQLLDMFAAGAKAKEKDYEMAQIAASPALTIYHQFFSRLLTGTWMACQAINSGKVKDDEKYFSDYVGLGLKKIGSLVPGVDKVTSIISEAISAWNYPDKKRAVKRMALMFPDLQTAFNQFGVLARLATLGQAKELKSFPPPSDDIVSKLKELYADAKTLLLFDDADTPFKRKAVEDCKLLLNAIKEGKLPEKPTLEQLLKVVLGQNFKYEEYARAAKKAPQSQHAAGGPAPSGNARCGMDVTSEIQRMKEQIAKLEESLPQDSHVEQGHMDVMVSISKSSIIAAPRAADHCNSEKVEEIRNEVALLRVGVERLKAKQEEHTDAILLNAEEAKRLKNLKNKSSCVIA